MESSKDLNYWPAFVDALSNVVLTLVFVLVIFVFALAMASNKVEKRMEEVSETAKKISQNTPQKENEELKKQLETVTTELQKLQAKTIPIDQQSVAAQNENKQIAVEKKTIDDANKGPVNIVQGHGSVVLNFPVSVSQMDEKSEEQLGHELEAIQKVTGKHKVIMRSIIGRETYSVARRMAYYRAINARNFLIGKMGEAPQKISISIVTPTQPEDGHVEIFLQKE